jgi:hypothetical protein
MLPPHPTKSLEELNLNAHTVILGKASLRGAFCKTKLYQRKYQKIRGCADMD